MLRVARLSFHAEHAAEGFSSNRSLRRPAALIYRNESTTAAAATTKPCTTLVGVFYFRVPWLRGSVQFHLDRCKAVSTGLTNATQRPDACALNATAICVRYSVKLLYIYTSVLRQYYCALFVIYVHFRFTQNIMYQNFTRSTISLLNKCSMKDYGGSY